MEMIEINKLKTHPRNQEFFDDITGERWEEFKNSILRRGVVEPIVVTTDMVVVSGHQRIRACKELSLLNIPCRITFYPEVDERTGTVREDMILEDLICTNVMQRGVGNVNPIKMAKCIMELERIKGIKKGGNGNNQYVKVETLQTNSPSQKDLADRLNITQNQLQRYKALTKLIPELQDLIEEGEIKPSMGYAVLSKLSKEEQEKIIEDLGKEQLKKMTQKEVKAYIEENNRLKEELKDLKNNPLVVEKVVDNTDYSLQVENSSLRKKAEYSESKVETLERIIENLEQQVKLAEESEKARLEEIKEYKEKEESLDRMIRDREGLTNGVNDVMSVCNYCDMLEEFVTKLSPLPHIRGMRTMAHIETAQESINDVVNKIRELCNEIEAVLLSKNMNITEEVEIIDIN